MDRREAKAPARDRVPTPSRAPARSRDLPAPRLARVILRAALLSYVGITLLNILEAGLAPLVTVAAAAALAAIFSLQLLHSAAGADRAPNSRKFLTLGIQALLTYLPIVLFQASWGSMAGFFAGSLLLLLRSRLAWTLYALVGLSMLLPPIIEGRPLVHSIYLCQSTLLTGLVVYGLSRLAELVREIHDTRGELARMAVTKERLRFARDLHDLLGFTLSAITLKTELILRLVPTHPERATEEVKEILTLSRQSLADVRLVASGFRDMSLEQEIRSTQSVLSAAEIETRVVISLDGLDDAVDTVLATALREAVTNLLRHSRASRCEIEAIQHDGRVRLVVVNDGASGGQRTAAPHSGSGIGNLQTRLRAVGGTLESGRGEDGTFRITAEAPARALAPPGDPGEEPADDDRAAAAGSAGTESVQGSKG